MKLLLTGASGFFGRNLLDLLSGLEEKNGGEGAAPIELHIAARTSGTAPSRFGSPASVQQIHQVDLLDHRRTSALVSEVKPTHLCHMAWVGPEHADRYNTPENDRWADASAALFRAFVETGGQRLVQLGSCIEYGNSASGVRVEGQPLAPDTAYGAAKARLSELVEDMGQDVSAAVARPFFCYGPHEQEQRLVSSLILSLQQGRPIDLTEGRQRRDYLDIRDIAAAIFTLLRNDNATGAFNIGAGEAVEVRTIAKMLGEITGRSDLLNFGARPEGADTAQEIAADIDRITATTDWKPTISLDEGLRSAAEWWLEQSGHMRE